MKRILSYFIFMLFLSALTPQAVFAKRSDLIETLCASDEYKCFKAESGDSWEKLWHDKNEREIVRKLNRTNLRVWKGMQIAYPKNLKDKSVTDFSPLPKKTESNGNQKILVDLKKLAWGAYDSDGNLVNWGPASGGKGWCPDVNARCRTPAGQFAIYRRGGAGCKSGKFPIGEGGAPMPYCMFFNGGYAVHGSYQVPGYNASHGCVRVYPEDAKWLNQEFIGPTSPKTEVMIRPY